MMTACAAAYWATVIQGAFHVVNPEDLRREIEFELLLGVAAYSLLPVNSI